MEAVSIPMIDDEGYEDIKIYFSIVIELLETEHD